MIAPDKCGNCKACKHACPGHYIDITVTGATVDRESCFKLVQERDGECFECLLACKHNILKLEKFTRLPSGNIVKFSRT